MATRMASRVFHQTCTKSAKTQLSRTFSSNGGNSENIVNIPLSKPLPNLATPQYATVDNKTYDTQVTVLENGLTVASEKQFGEFVTVGVAIDSGSRYEVAYPTGISHFLEKLSFGTCSKFENKDVMLQTLEKYGGVCDCQGSRDVLMYAISADKGSLPGVVDILGEAILRPRITELELEEATRAIEFDLEMLHTRPDPDQLLQEMIHAAAYRSNTLGLPKFSDQENIGKIDRSILYSYLSNHHTANRMVLAGVGMDHSELVKLAQEYFIDKKKPIWEENKDIIDTKKKVDKSISQYTGGIIKVEKDLTNISQGPNPLPDQAHIVIGFESCATHDPDFVAYCVLHQMLGGGSSFSAGGPGKGMFTRLYQNVLNRHHFVHNATTLHYAYEDSGLFSIYGSSDPSQLKELSGVITDEIINTTGKIYDMEFKRAKRQLQSMLLMNLECRPIVFEDIARQVLSRGLRQPAMFYYDAIENITKEDIHRIATKMLKTKPSIAAYGDLRYLPKFEEFETAFATGQGLLKKNNFSFLGLRR